MKGIKFISRCKAIIDVSKHSEIMEDAVDRVIIKEAKRNGDFVSWNKVKKSLDEKHGLDGLPNTNGKESRKISAKSPKKRRK